MSAFWAYTVRVNLDPIPKGDDNVDMMVDDLASVDAREVLARAAESALYKHLNRFAEVAPVEGYPPEVRVEIENADLDDGLREMGR